MSGRHLIAVLLGCQFLATQVESEDSPLGFEAIFDLPFIESLELSTDEDVLLVATEGHLLHWQLKPLELLQSIEIDIIPNELTFGPDGDLYTVGLSFNQQGRDHQTTSKAVSFARLKDEGMTFEVADESINIGLSQYSTIAFDSEELPIVASASSYTASPLASKGNFVNGEATVFPQLKFNCGGASQMSIVMIDNQDYYIMSIAGVAALEIGKVTLGDGSNPDGECFSVERSTKGQTARTSFDSLRHVVIDIENTDFAERGAQKGVLVLDPNSNSLSLFRIEPYGDGQFLSRVDALEISLDQYMPVKDRGVVLNELASDEKGHEILVASNSANVVLRFEFKQGRLRSRGRFAMGGPVRDLELSASGTSAAIVTGSEPYGGDWRIVVIANPAALSDWLQIPASFPSIRNLQQLLNDNGFPAGVPDGILGPQTSSAVASYWAEISGPQDAKPNPELERAIISSFPSYLVQQRQ